MKTSRLIAAVAIAAAAALTVSGCTEDNEPNASNKARDKVNSEAKNRAPYIPKNDVEFNNYNSAQKLYDDPSSIIWCTTTWGNNSAPLVTVPIAGKLTSSSVSYFPNTKVDYNANGNIGVEQRSVDGMYHGNPPGYRYGFTPGGQYVDFFNMNTFCTTALTEFQRENTAVSITTDTAADNLQAQAEAALKAGDKDKAQALLEGLSTVEATK